MFGGENHDPISITKLKLFKRLTDDLHSQQKSEHKRTLSCGDVIYLSGFVALNSDRSFCQWATSMLLAEPFAF